MRHWHFKSVDDVDERGVLAYMLEALENQRLGVSLAPAKKAKEKITIPDLLKKELNKNPKAERLFNTLPYYKQKEYLEYISAAKQDKTKLARLKKIVPMILEGKGLNDVYR